MFSNLLCKSSSTYFLSSISWSISSIFVLSSATSVFKKPFSSLKPISSASKSFITSCNFSISARLILLVFDASFNCPNILLWFALLYSKSSSTSFKWFYSILWSYYAANNCPSHSAFALLWAFILSLCISFVMLSWMISPFNYWTWRSFCAHWAFHLSWRSSVSSWVFIFWFRIIRVVLSLSFSIRRLPSSREPLPKLAEART